MFRLLLLGITFLGMNAIFGLKAKLSIGEQVMIGVMTGTAVFITALPPPPMLQVSSQGDAQGDADSDKRLVDIRKKLMEINKRNIQFHGVHDVDDTCRKRTSTSESCDVDVMGSRNNDKLDLLVDGKDTFVLEVGFHCVISGSWFMRSGLFYAFFQRKFRIFSFLVDNSKYSGRQRLPPLPIHSRRPP